MNTTTALAARLQEVLLDGRWIANTNLKEQLLTLNWQQANQRIGSLNTIALLTFHLNYYLEGVLDVFNGGPLTISDKYSFDMPPVTNAADWEKMVRVCISNSEKLIRAVEQLNEEQLSQTFVDEKYGNYQRNIESIIEHSYYHLGQITLLKKMVTDN
jgi:uncharacterized damage-inducible protein DinB